MDGQRGWAKGMGLNFYFLPVTILNRISLCSIELLECSETFDYRVRGLVLNWWKYPVIWRKSKGK